MKEEKFAASSYWRIIDQITFVSCLQHPFPAFLLLKENILCVCVCVCVEEGERGIVLCFGLAVLRRWTSFSLRSFYIMKYH